MQVRLAVVLVALVTVTTAFFITAPPVRASTPPTIGLPTTLPDYMRYVIVNNYKFDPLQQLPTIPDSLRYTSLEANQQAYFIVQLKGPVTVAMKANLAATGAVILSYINYNAYIVRATPTVLQRVQNLAEVRWTGVFEPAYKLSPTLSDSYAKAAQDAMQTELNGGQAAGVVTVLGSGNTPAKSMSVDALGRPTSASSTNVAPSAASVSSAASAATSASGTMSMPYGSPSSATPGAFATYSSSRITVNILTFETAWVPAATQAVAKLGGSNILFNFNYAGWGTIQAQISKDAVPALAFLPGVMWIDRVFQPYVFNDIARWVIQSGNSTTFATPVHDHGIYGTNQTVTLADTGIDYKHPDFWDPGNTTPGPTARKLTAYYDPPCPPGGCDLTDNGINHGTHTSGSVAGDDGQWHVYNGDATGSNGTTGPHDGQAFDAKLNMQDTSSDGQFIYFNNVNDLWSLAVNHSSWIHSNSWGSCCSQYIADSATTDAFVWNNVNFTIVFAAGNSGSSLSTMNPYGGAKNVIAVGATGNGLADDTVASFSSRGPMNDGRLKPDVMAPGVGLWSAKGACPSPCGGTTYWQLSGTSMATPTTSGGATLIRQYYMDGWYPSGTAVPADGFTPSAALIKATLINSAVEMTGSGAYDNGQNYYPNDNQGWGRILLDNALYFQGDTRHTTLDDYRAGLQTGNMVNYTLAIGDTSEPVKISLVWTDYPGNPATTPNLVNDLDLVVTAPDGTVYRGNVFAGQNPGQSVPNPPASSTDHLNNVENVLVISGVQSGVWTVSVIADNVPQGPQPYALVMTGGIATNAGQLGLDHGHYKSNAVVNLTVVDTGLNTNPNAPDTATVNMTSNTETTPEIATLTETGNDTAVFTGTMPLQNSATPIPGDGILQVQNGDTITADYFDANNGQGQSVHVVRTAIVDDTPPVISAINVTNLRFNRATIVWTTDEPATSVVDWGGAVPPVNTTSNGQLVTSHSLDLKSLAQNTTYFFGVSSTDEAGNTATDNNGTNYYQFTTPTMPPTAAPSYDWPTFHNNNPRLGLAPRAFSPPLTQIWTDGPYTLQLWNGPVFADGILFTAPLDGTLRARDPYTGRTLWTRHLGDQNYYTGTPVVEDGVLFGTWYGASGGWVYALDENTGATIWVDGPSTGLDFNARVAMAAADGMVFGSTWGGQIYALDQSNGTIVWAYQTGESFPFGGPTVSAGLVFQGTTTNDLFALDEFSGNLVWKATLDGPITSVPLYAGGVVYEGTNGGSMFALDAFTGSVIWQNSAFGFIDFSTPAYDGTNLYFGSYGNDAFYAVDAATGAIVWTTGIGAPVGTTVAYANGFVYGNAWDGIFRVMDASTGNIVDQYYLNSFASTSAPAISDGWVWFEDYSGNAYGFFGNLPVGFTLSPATQTIDTVPNSQVNFPVTVVNVGTSGPDVFDVNVTLGSLGWSLSLFKADGTTPLPDTNGDGTPDTGSLGTGANATIIARVTVPSSVNPGDTDTSVLTINSVKDHTFIKEAKLTAVVPPPGVSVGPRRYFAPNPGDLISATMNVMNTGGFPDTIDVHTNGTQSWTVNLFKADGTTPLPDTNGDGIPDTGLLAGLTSATIVVKVQVPSSATLGVVDKVSVTGNSSVDPSATGTGVVVIELVAPPDAQWPTFHNNNPRHGQSPSMMSPPLSQFWTSGPATEGLWTSPILADNILFSTSLDGYIRAYDPYSGSVLWADQLGGTYYYTGTPTAVNGIVYVMMDTGSVSGLYALNEQTGAIVWADLAGSPFFNARVALAYDSGMIFGTSWSNDVFAVNSTDGSLVWDFNTGGADLPYGGATINGGLVYIGGLNGNLYALDERTGAVVWDDLLDGTISSVPLYAQGLVFVGTYGGTMWAVDSQTGATVWSSGGFNTIDVSTPSYDGNALYFGSFANMYIALDVGTGAVLWETPIGGPVGSSTAYANGFVYGTSWDGYLRVMNATTGQIVDQHFMTSYASTSSPAVARGWVWAQDTSGALYGYGAVGAGVVREVDVSPSPVSVPVTSAILLRAHGVDAYGNPLRLTNVSWASMNSMGTIIPVSPTGDTIVYVAGTVAGADDAVATSGGFSGDGAINILPGPQDHVAVAPSPITLVAGSTQQFSASAVDRYGNPVGGASFTWAVVGSIGTISASGMFTASTTAGTGVITATSGTTVGTAQVDVVPGPISTLSVTPSSVSVQAGSLVTLSAAAKDAFGNAIPGAPISWSASAGTITPLNSDESLALYSPLTQAGSATITVSSGSKSVTVSVVVLPGLVAVVTLNPSSPTVQAGATQAFTATATDVYGNVVTGSVVWSASAGSITDAGVFTAPTTAGPAQVSATMSGHEVTATVTVTAAALDHLVLSPTSVSVPYAGGASLSVSGVDQYGNAVSGVTYTWSTTLGTVQSTGNGQSAAFFAGTSTGSGTITVTASGGKTATLAVTVGAAPVVAPSLTDQLSSGPSILFLVLTIVFAALAVVMFVQYSRARKELNESRRGGSSGGEGGGAS